VVFLHISGNTLFLLVIQVHTSRRHNYREIAIAADRKLLLRMARMALMGAGYEGGREKLLDEILVTINGWIFAMSRCVRDGNVEDYRYEIEDELLTEQRDCSND